MFVNDAQICNYADSKTIYACDNSIDSIIETLEGDALKIAEWFPNNCMKLNEDKCHLMVFGNKSNNKYRKCQDKREHGKKAAWSDSGQNIIL